MITHCVIAKSQEIRVCSFHLCARVFVFIISATSGAINVATSDTLDVVATVQVIETDQILERIYKETMCTN